MPVFYPIPSWHVLPIQSPFCSSDANQRHACSLRNCWYQNPGRTQNKWLLAKLGVDHCFQSSFQAGPTLATPAMTQSHTLRLPPPTNRLVFNFDALCLLPHQQDAPRLYQWGFLCDYEEGIDRRGDRRGLGCEHESGRA